MKKIILLFLLNISIISAQENDVWLFQIHEMEVSGNVNDFIKLQKEYHKKLAVLGVENNEWAGWQCLRSVTSGNKFIFLHHFNSVEQRVDPQIWTEENLKKLGLKSPEGNSFTTKTTNPIYIYQAHMALNDKEPSKYWKINYHKFNNRSNYINHNKSWGEMVVKKTQKKEDGMNWGFATLISNGEGFDGKPQMYNGISFDGYATMEQMLESSLYNETMDPLVQKWYENSQKNKWNTAQIGGKFEMWTEVASTFN